MPQQHAGSAAHRPQRQRQRRGVQPRRADARLSQRRPDRAAVGRARPPAAGRAAERHADTRLRRGVQPRRADAGVGRAERAIGLRDLRATGAGRAAARPHRESSRASRSAADGTSSPRAATTRRSGCGTCAPTADRCCADRATTAQWTSVAFSPNGRMLASARPTTTRSASGTSARIASWGASTVATSLRAASPSARMGRRSPPPTTTPRSGYGTWRPAGRSAGRCAGTAARSKASPSAPMAGRSSRVATTTLCGCGTSTTTARSAHACAATRARSKASPSARTARRSHPVPTTTRFGCGSVETERQLGEAAGHGLRRRRRRGVQPRRPDGGLWKPRRIGPLVAGPALARRR